MGYAALSVYAAPGSAVSTEAMKVSLAAKTVIRSAETSQALFGSRVAAISQVRLLASECAESDWDGNDAYSIEATTVQNVENFIRAFPDSVPLPEFAPEPDGSISLDWISSRHRMFSLSVGPTDRLAYAWLDGTDKGHAVARFDGHSIPLRILDGIRVTLSNGNAFVRSA